MYARIAFIAALSATGCESKGPSNAAFSISVDNAKLERAIAQTQAGPGDVFLDVSVTLTNSTESSPLPATFSRYSLETTSALVYPPSAASAALVPSCGNVAVARGGHLTCRVAFELPADEMPSQIIYTSAMGDLVATAPIPSASPLPCGGPGLRCSNGGECCTGVCDAAAKICSLIGGACAAAGAACHNPTECCTGNCYAGICAEVICLPSGATCTATTTNCCNWSCGGRGQTNRCVGLSGCGTLGDFCSTDSDCCSETCGGGRCIRSPSTNCGIDGELCFTAGDCCGAMCNIEGFDVVGTCGSPRPSPSP
jgi:hypothetical protein